MQLSFSGTKLHQNEDKTQKNGEKWQKFDYIDKSIMIICLYLPINKNISLGYSSFYEYNPVLRLVLLIKIKAYEESFYIRNDSVPGNDHNG